MEKIKKKLGQFRAIIGSSSQPSVTQDDFGRFRAAKGSKSWWKRRADDGRSEHIRRQAKLFRILIIGRANAGKTTILQKVCNTVEQPEIFDSEGNKIDISVVAPTVQRGAHNVENELVFQSNPGFVFHDSRGFEAGGVVELNTVKEFIAKRSKMADLSSQLHIIWYCIPMDDERPFTTAERSFFSECGTGRVPVVAIFTKFDALEDIAYSDLKNEGVSHEDAVVQTAARAMTDFKRMYLPELYKRQYPPKGHVYLRDMDKRETTCRELTEIVATVLDNDNLRQLFVSTQQNNLEICIKYALTRCFIPAIMKMEQITATIPTDFQEEMARWYPHFSAYPKEVGGRYDQLGLRAAHGRVVDQDLVVDQPGRRYVDYHCIRQRNIQNSMYSLIDASPAPQQIVIFGVVLAIILEHSFYLWNQAQRNDTSCLTSAIGVYKSSGKHTAVTHAINEVFKEECLFEEAKGSEHPAESAFAHQLIEIVLDNCLSPP